MEQKEIVSIKPIIDNNVIPQKVNMNNVMPLQVKDNPIENVIPYEVKIMSDRVEVISLKEKKITEEELCELLQRDDSYEPIINEVKPQKEEIIEPIKENYVIIEKIPVTSEPIKDENTENYSTIFGSILITSGLGYFFGK
jgi:hypothetical protein